MVPIPPGFRDIFAKRAFAHIATVDEHGMPQSTPVWVAYDGEHILISSARGRKKDSNLRERPDQVALSVTDPDDPYRYVGVQGRVAEITEEGARDLIEAFAQRYWGRSFKHPAGQVRVTYKIEPLRVWTDGPAASE